MKVTDRSTRPGRLYDLVIVGAGPAGLAAAETASRSGLSYVVLERGQIAQTICDYPIARPLHSPPQELELLWGELQWARRRVVTREELLAHYHAFALQRGHLHIRTGEPVEQIERSARGFFVRTAARSYQSHAVLLATGGFGVPRRLQVPGESADRVSYRFSEGFSWAGGHVLVVGGGNSAAEAALWLHESAARVTLSLRRPGFEPREGTGDAFTTVKSFNRDQLLALAAAGRIRIMFSSEVVGVTEGAAIVRTEGRKEPCAVACRHVFALIGADPDLTLLRGIGAGIASDGRPVYDRETGETTVAGLYVAGHLTRELHIANAIRAGRRVVRQLAGEALQPAGAAAFLAACAAGATEAVRIRSAWARRLLRDHDRLRQSVQAMARVRENMAEASWTRPAGMARLYAFSVTGRAPAASGPLELSNP